MAVTGRFAPSPSGRIHLGNILCCLLSWLSARQKGGRVILRIEDLDTARCPRRYGEQMIRDIRWLGLDWDEGPERGGPGGPYEQSLRTELYQGRSGAAGGPRGWSTRASAPGRSSMRPAPLTGRTGRSSTPAPAGI